MNICKMNIYKLRAVIDHIRRQGRLPRDQWDNRLSLHDQMVWFGLDRVLTSEEQDLVKCELNAIAEAEDLADQLR